MIQWRKGISQTHSLVNESSLLTFLFDSLLLVCEEIYTVYTFFIFTSYHFYNLIVHRPTANYQIKPFGTQQVTCFDQNVSYPPFIYYILALFGNRHTLNCLNFHIIPFSQFTHTQNDRKPPSQAS